MFYKYDIVIHNRSVRHILDYDKENNTYKVSFPGGYSQGVKEEELQQYPINGYIQICPNRITPCNVMHEVKVGDIFSCTNPNCFYKEEEWRGDIKQKLLATPLGTIPIDTEWSTVGNNRCYPFRNRELYPGLDNPITTGHLFGGCGDNITNVWLQQLLNTTSMDILKTPCKDKDFYHRIAKALKHFELYYYGLKTEWEFNWILKQLNLARMEGFYLNFRERTKEDDLIEEVRFYEPMIAKAIEEGQAELKHERTLSHADPKGVARLLRDFDSDILRMEGLFGTNTEKFYKLKDRKLGEKLRKVTWSQFKE